MRNLCPYHVETKLMEESTGIMQKVESYYFEEMSSILYLKFIIFLFICITYFYFYFSFNVFIIFF